MPAGPGTDNALLDGVRAGGRPRMDAGQRPQRVDNRHRSGGRGAVLAVYHGRQRGDERLRGEGELLVGVATAAAGRRRVQHQLRLAGRRGIQLRLYARIPHSGQQQAGGRLDSGQHFGTPICQQPAAGLDQPGERDNHEPDELDGAGVAGRLAALRLRFQPRRGGHVQALLRVGERFDGAPCACGGGGQCGAAQGVCAGADSADVGQHDDQRTDAKLERSSR